MAGSESVKAKVVLEQSRPFLTNEPALEPQLVDGRTRRASAGRLRLAAIAALLGLASQPLYAAGATKATVGHPYHLHASTGQFVTDTTFVGKVQIALFGYTNCPDVCPTTLSSVSQAVKRLGARGCDVQILFISVDPDRDSPGRLTQYARAFGPHVLALTGTRAEIDDSVEAFRARYRIDADDAGGYTVSHTGYVYLFDRSGKLFGTLPPNTTAAQYVPVLEKLLASTAIPARSASI